MYKIGFSFGIKTINDELFMLIKNSGIDAIEISYDNYDDLDFKGIKQLADKYDIELWSLHLPFWPFDKLDPSSFDHIKKQHTFDTFIEIIKKGADIGIDKFVVHPSAEPIADNERTARLESAAEFFDNLAEEAFKYGAIIALEDLPRTCLGRNSEEINYLLAANDKLRVCFDTNHLLKESIADFIENVGSKIISLHVSDFDFVNERHWLPGEGDIDWLELKAKLDNVGYNGVWLYELGLKPPKSINRRDMTFRDLYNNANEILNGKKPSAIGKRIENLGFWGPQ